MRPTPFLLVLVLAAVPMAAAQSGPPAGYDDPATYAQDHVQDEADQASADPAGYAGDHASPEAVADEAEHGAWLACWSADAYADVEADACDPYYTPAGEVGAIQEDPAPDEAENATDEAVNATEEYAAEVQDIAQDLVDDPDSAPSHLERLVDATVRFVERVVGAILAVPLAIAEAAIKTVEGLLTGIGAAGYGLGLTAESSLDGVAAVADVATDSASASVSAVGSALGAVADAAGTAQDAARSVADGYVDRAGDQIDRFQDGVAAVGSGVADGIGDAAHAAMDAARAVKDTVASWFDGDDAPAKERLPDAGKDVTDTTDGLVDTALGLLE